LKEKAGIVPGKIHKLSYSNPVLKQLHDELREMFKDDIGSPFVFVNTRMWKTKSSSKSLGPNAFHLDGFEPGHLKIMVYLTPLNNEYGPFEWKDTKGKVICFNNEPAGTAICFKNSDIIHRGVPGSTHDRVSIEVTLMRSIIDGHQTWPGHFFGRHLYHPKLLNKISRYDIS